MLVNQSNWRCWSPRKLLGMIYYFSFKKKQKTRTSRLPHREGTAGWEHTSIEVGAADWLWESSLLSNELPVFSFIFIRPCADPRPMYINSPCLCISIVVGLYVCYLQVWTTSQWAMDCYLQSTDEKLEAQRSTLNCPEHTTNKWMNQIIYLFSKQTRLCLKLCREKKEKVELVLVDKKFTV